MSPYSLHIRLLHTSRLNLLSSLFMADAITSTEVEQTMGSFVSAGHG